MKGPAEQDRIDDEAALWHARIGGDDVDWQAFSAWLDIPACRLAYERIALIDAEIIASAAAISAQLPANDDVEDARVPRSRKGWWAAGGTLTAGVVAGMLLLPMLTPAAEMMATYNTGPTETRTIALKDGSTIRIDRNSRLSVSDSATRRIDLAAGGAYFDIRHDPSHPLTVTAGGYEVRDVGTRFDMVHQGQRVSVAVAEGEVAVAPANGRGTPLRAGRRIDILGPSAEAAIATVNPANVGSWRDGRLIYDQAALALVATDISRYAGKTLTVDPAIADLRFSGVLTIGDGSRLVDQIQGLLPVDTRREGNRIRLVGRAAR
ncbi:FecR family protein [Sphingomonas sp. YR710]|uniref:FecR family protein n=1 Tax=Sphingomonas sp. YR710 TaxID=1882773 RepID=UPI000883DF92|nr:FecR domain-containing protein [Sphingomonas sp. YR710]SDD02793.1 FecR family protein [Sphingomonas sp. YR710]